MNINSFL